MLITTKTRKFGALPKDDPRTKLLAATIRKSGGRPDALIQVLHAAQNLYGYLPMEVIHHVAREMKLPPSRVFGVATFYHFFSLKPKGKHTCLVCTGTACYVKGAQAILDRIETTYGLKPGEVTPDDRLGLQTARCIGACGLAPAIVVDEVVIAKVDAEKVPEIIENRIGANT